jgi:hypothetical protein
MADTKITRLRNLLTPFRNYFALLEEQENEPSLVMQDKMQTYLDTEKERIFKMQAEVWDIIAEIPNEACEGKNADLKNANCAIFDVSQLLAFRKWQKENWKDIYLMSDEFMIETYKKANCG